MCRAGSECLGPGHPCSSENSPGRGAPDGLQEESSESLAFGFGEPHKAGSCSRTCSNRTSSVPGWQRHKYLWTLCILNGFENDSSQETAPQSHSTGAFVDLHPHAQHELPCDTSGADVICTSRLSQSSLANCLTTFAVLQKCV